MMSDGGPVEEVLQLVTALRTLTAHIRDPLAIVDRIGPLVRELALSKAWLQEKHLECDPDQGLRPHPSPFHSMCTACM